MKIFSNETFKKNEIKNLIVTIGSFDGFHLGHKELLKVSLSISLKISGFSMIYTFKTNPKNNLEGVPYLLTTNEERIEIAERFKVDGIFFEEFTDEYKSLKGEEFISKILYEKLNAKIIVVGENFKFGFNRSSNAYMLKNIVSSYGIQTEIVPIKKMGNHLISSSQIRKMIKEGDVNGALWLLGHPYIVIGKVVPGDKRGRRLGFPTANILIENPLKLLPQDGVYAVYGSFDNKILKGVANIGYKPTFLSSSTRSLETYFLDFSENLYDKVIIFHFLQKIRDEKKFKTEDDLKAQILKDIEETRKILSLYNIEEIDRIYTKFS